MKSRILISLAIVGLSSASAGVGLYAYFTSTALSTNNVFGAGTLDLLAGGAKSSDAFIAADNVKPGDTIRGTLALSNLGTLTGGAFDLDIAMDVSQDATKQMSSFMRLTELTYGDVNQLALVVDSNANGFADLADLDASNAALADLPDPGALGKNLNLTVVFDTSAGNDLQGESMSMAWTFFLAQVDATDLAS